MLDGLFKKFLRSINNGTAPPWLQKALWKGWYQILARRWRDDGWSFMNYGWLPLDRVDAFCLEPADESDRYFIGLYYHLSSLLELNGKRVLEVGSGRGGGASYIARYHHPGEVVGLDFSPAAIALSRRLHADVNGLSFIEGDAEKLPFSDGEFDVVINVESSHCYGDMPAFVNEVARVLRPGGMFAWADIRGPGMMEATEKAFSHPHMLLLHEEDITANVLKALDSAHARKSSVINGLRLGQALVRQFAAMPGSTIYQSLSSGDVRYLSRIYRRA